MTAIVRVIDEFDQELHVRDFAPSDSFADAVMGEWPDGFPGYTPIVMSPEWKVVSSYDACEQPMGDGTWTIVLRPQGPVIAFLGSTAFTIGATTVTWLQVAVTALALLGNYLFRPELPQITNNYEWDEERPQFFSGQSNRLRPGARVPDLLGTMRIWPDLIAEPWTRYTDGDKQTITELYVVSNGHVDIKNARFGDEDIGAIPASSYTVFHPGETWPIGTTPGAKDHMEYYRTNTFVGGTELPGPNEDTALTTTFSFSGNTITASTAGFFTEFPDAVGNIFRIVDVGGNLDPANDEFYTVASVAGDGTSMTITSTFAVVQNNIGGLRFRGANFVTSLSGSSAITSWDRLYRDSDDGWIALNEWVATMTSPPGTNPPDPTQGSIVNTGVGADELTNVTYQYYPNRVGIGGPVAGLRYGTTLSSPHLTGNVWFVVWREGGNYNPDVPGTGITTPVFQIPGENIDRIEFDIGFPGGLFQQSAGQPPAPRSVTVRMWYRRFDATGSTTTWASTDFVYSTKTRTERRFTSGLNVSHSNATGDPSFPYERYEVFFERLTDSTDDTGNYVAQDACELISLRGRQYLVGSAVDGDVLNCTLVKLELSTQSGAQVLNQRRFNVVGTRHLPNRRTTGTPGELTETNKLIDALLYSLIDAGGGGYDATNIDIAHLESIETDLIAIGDGADQFHAILDQTVSIEDQAQTVASPARIILYRRGSQLYFNRMKAGIAPRYLFNARNKIEPEKRTLQFGDSNRPTSVIIRFLDETDQYREATVQYPTGAAADVSPEEQSVLGITNPKSAERTAQYIWDKRLYERDLIEAAVAEEGVQCAPGDVVAVTDHLLVETPVDGEVISAATSVYTFDQDIPAGTYRAMLRGTNGGIIGDGTYTVPTTGARRDQLNMSAAGWPASPTPPDAQSQAGLLYSFIPLTSSDATLMQVLSITPSPDGPVTLAGVAYRDETYQSDGGS